jgi:hypothetical protein
MSDIKPKVEQIVREAFVKIVQLVLQCRIELPATGKMNKWVLEVKNCRCMLSLLLFSSILERKRLILLLMKYSLGAKTSTAHCFSASSFTKQAREHHIPLGEHSLSAGKFSLIELGK